MAEGSVFPVDGGKRWRGVYQHNGTRKYVYGKTRSEAKRKIKELQKQIEQGRLLGTPEQTIAQFLQSWLDGHVKHSCKQRTYDSYEETMRNRILPFVGNKRLTTLTVAHVQDMVKALKKKNLSQRTIQYAVTVLSRALNKAIEYGYIVRNPAAKVRVRVEKPEKSYLTPDQARLFLKATEGHRFHLLYRMAIYMGLRRGELLAIRWEDIDFEAQTLTIRQAKTDAGVRVLPLSQAMNTALQQQKEMHGFVFSSKNGTQIIPKCLFSHFKRTLKQLGLPDIRFHDLRHTCASLMYEANIPEGLISKMLGHKKVSTTMDIYTHFRRQNLAEAARKMEDFL